MARYVDGFILPVPKKSVEKYRRIAASAGDIWMEHGALQYVECVGEDINVKHGVPFSTTVAAKRSEAVIFAYIVFKSRAHRDRVNAKVMKDPRIEALGEPSKGLFDMKRMVYGGFQSIVER